ncbi:MAG: hypothetical protein F6K25_26360 [Okeania sp. SIO2G4]|uniref:hypothetical protein n=1 Tax=unclassified Okeania TaxID=2634635 RepID=UPI0013B8B8C0|nr:MULTISPECIES: hypothetical protein [unclassified Okeania]NEP05125.1 hypothetical protein [Okeania sp. SIO4D6]NEP75191.1 hypothetical protein [Okeania sp. SIO2G5]NEP96241.1 hypothetical protein [Okeania sp. SIO2F5]NEQ93985.1 hypothetical protein [Okeania sp. SIO2G4]
MIKIVFATGTRCGSEFLIKLTNSVLQENPTCISSKFSSLTPGRNESVNKEILKPNYKFFWQQNQPLEYFRLHNIESVKIEHPGKDMLAVEISSSFPKAKFLSTIRPIEEIVLSHSLIPKWGKKKEEVVSNWIADLNILEYLGSLGRLFILDINNHKYFSSDKFLNFLECAITDRFKYMESNWPKVNSLDYQLGKKGKVSDLSHKNTALTRQELIDLYPIIPSIEERYHKLLN